MTLVTDLAAADADRIFLDWGRTAQLVEVVQYYDPDSGRLEESEFAMEVQVVFGPGQPRDRVDVVAATPVIDRLFLIREADLPARLALTSARLRLDERIYEIRSVVPSSLTGVIALECVAENGLPEVS
jgi:hypothetical protein